MASMAGGAMPPPPPGLPPYDPSGQHRPVHQPNHNGRSEHRPPAHGTSTHKSDKHRQQGHDKHRPHHDKSHPPSKSKGPPVAAPAPQPLSTALDARLRRDTPFLATIRFKNDLPEVPGDPKLLVVQQPPEKLAAFSLTTIEKEPKHDLILPPDLGITLSILDMERYAVPATKPTLHPDDLKLLGPDADTLLGSGPLAGVSKAILGIQNSPQEKRRGTALRSAAEVSWLMRTTYLSAEAEATKKGREQTEYDARREKMQRNPASVEPEAGDEEAQRQAQLRMIEATFAAARAPPVHRTKPTMRAVEVMEVLPDTDWWGHKFMSAHFDKDPSDEVDELVTLSNPDLARHVVGMGVLKGFKLEEEQSQASARGGKDNASNGRFMALLLPRDIPAAAATLQEQGASGLPSDQLEGEYNWAREYSYNLISKKNQKEDRESGKSGLQQSYLIRFQGGKALYCEVNSKLELRSKREAGARSRGANQFQRPSKVVLGKRAMTAKEVEDVKRQCLALSSVAVDDGDEGRGGAGDAGDDEQWGS